MASAFFTEDENDFSAEFLEEINELEMNTEFISECEEITSEVSQIKLFSTVANILRFEILYTALGKLD